VQIKKQLAKSANCFNLWRDTALHGREDVGKPIGTPLHPIILGSIANY
jgi:hypothetical protein